MPTPKPQSAISRERTDRSLMTMDLAELIGRLRTHDNDAWSEVVRRYTPVVRSRVNAIGLTPPEADDAAQQTWLKLDLSIDSIQDPARLGGWLRVTARNEAINILRQKQRLELTDQLEHRQSHDPEVDRRLHAEEAVNAVNRAMAGLTERQREVVRLRYLDVDVASYAEISEELAMPTGAIGPTLGRALSQMGNHPSVVALADRSAPSSMEGPSSMESLPAA